MVHIFPFAFSHVAAAYLFDVITTRCSPGCRSAHRRRPETPGRRARARNDRATRGSRGFNRARPKPRPFTRLAPARSILKATAPLSTRNEASAADPGPSASCRTRMSQPPALRPLSFRRGCELVDVRSYDPGLGRAVDAADADGIAGVHPAIEP